MPNIFDYVNATEIAAYIENLPTNQVPIFGNQLFPQRKLVGTDISWLKGKGSIPVAITPSNYDAKATLRERTGFSKMDTEMAFFREAMRIGEKDRQEINKLLNHPNSNIVMPIIRNIFDDVNKLVDGVTVQAEYMRMQLLQYGKFKVTNADSSVQYQYDYGMSTEHQITTTIPWTEHAKSVPVRDIIAACDKIEEDTGIRPTRGVMNRTTFLDMIASESIKKDVMVGVAASSWDNRFMSEQEAKAYIEKKTGVKLFIYSKKIGVLDSTSLTPDMGHLVKLVDDNIVCLFPEGPLGNTWFGTTPEESDLMSGAGNATVSLVNGGTAVTTYKEIHPVNVNTVVSAVMIPSFERIDNVAVLKTVGGSGGSVSPAPPSGETEQVGK